jgi:hypothetical protein
MLVGTNVFMSFLLPLLIEKTLLHNVYLTVFTPVSLQMDIRV